jgi:hypothetical protein
VFFLRLRSIFSYSCKRFLKLLQTCISVAVFLGAEILFAFLFPSIYVTCWTLLILIAFFSFVLILTSFCLLIVGVEGYCLHLTTFSDTYTLGETPLDERSARCKDLYLTTHNSHKGQTSMPLAGFEPAIPASELPQIDSLNRVTFGMHVSLITLRVRIKHKVK